MHDVLIIGSGVIGMSIARQLSQSHLDIALIDVTCQVNTHHIKQVVC